MLNSLTLNNFQSHSSTRLDFSPGINSIIGASDSGKSAILRSLYWLISNRPSGDAFVSHWARDKKGNQNQSCAVVLDVDGAVITRERRTDFNGYHLSGEKTPFEAVRTDVPEKVAKALNITEINIQKQLDSPFLLSSTSGEVAKFLNQLVNLDTIDTAFTVAASKKKAAKQKLEAANDRAAQIDSELTRLDWVPGVGELIKQADKQNTALLGAQERTFALRASIGQVALLRASIQDCAVLVSLVPLVERCRGLNTAISTGWKDITQANKTITAYSEYSQIVKSCAKYTDLSGTVIKARQVGEAVKQSKKLVELLNKTVEGYTINRKIVRGLAQVAEITENGELKQVEANFTILQEKKTAVQKLKNDIEAYNNLRTLFENSENNLAELKKQRPAICPYCGK